MWRRVLNWLRSRLPSRPPKKQPRVELTADGFDVVLEDETRVSIKWASVTQVVTYKYDLFGYDEIVIAFAVLERPEVLQEVSEEWQGFNELRTELEGRLGIAPEWYETVMLPPFETNYRVLLERQPSPSEGQPAQQN